MVELEFKWMVLGILGTWRMTHLLHAELGPWRVLDRIRAAVGRVLGTHLMECFYCLSVWVALPFGWLLGADWLERFLAVLAFSAGAILLERVTNPGFATGSPNPIPPAYFEGEEANHELLQSTSSDIDRTTPRKG